MSKINKWRIYCTTENKWSYGWLEDNSLPPANCFNDTTHIVNLESVNIVDFLTSNEVSLLEEKIKTQGNFRNHGFSINIPANTTHTYEMTLNYPINLLLIWFKTKSENIGDIFNAYYQIPLNGLLTSNLPLYSTILNIDNIIINIIKIGFVVSLKRLSDNYIENLGEILAIDKMNNTITVTNPTSQNFLMNDEIIIKVNGVKDINLSVIGRHPTGSSKLGATYLSSTGIISVVYENKSPTVSKTFEYELEYLY